MSGMEMLGTWNYRLVALSVLVAIVGTYIALYFAAIMRLKTGWFCYWMLALGAFMMGLAIWSMHFIGMMALQMPMPVSYDPVLTGLSIVAAIIGAALAFLLLSRKTITLFHLITGSVAMGLAIVTMHYMGMTSMQMRARIEYDPLWFIASILIAIFASALAFQLAYRPRQEASFPPFTSAIALGVAISGMHYAGMHAAHYFPITDFNSSVNIAYLIDETILNELLIVALAIFGGMLLLIAAQSAMEREKLLQSLRESEARYRSFVTSNAIGFFVSSTSGKIFDCNDAFLDIIGYSRSELDAGLLDWRMLTPPEYQAQEESNVNAVRKKGFAPEHEKQFFHKEGHRVDVWLGGIALVEGTTDLVTACVLDITEKKRAALALEESEARFRQMVASNLIGIAFWNIYGKIYDANEAFLTMLGYTRDEMLHGQVNLQDVILPEEQWIHAEKVQKAIAGEPIAPYETRYIHRNGHQIDVLVGYAMLESSRDQGFAFSLDISERKKAEAALHESAEQFRFMAESMPQKLWTATADRAVDYVNANWTEYTGFSREELLGDGWTVAIHPDDLEPTLIAWHSALEKGEPAQIEHRILRADGVYRWHLTRALPMRDANRKVVMWLGTNTDIDDMKQAQAAIGESEERFRTMADQAPILIWLTDTQGKTIYMNKKWEEYIDISVGDNLDQRWLGAVHPEERQIVQNFFLDAMMDKRPYEAQYRLRTKRGEYRWIHDTGVPFYTMNGEFAGYVGSNVDETEQKRVHEELEIRVSERTAQLQTLNHELETFSYSVSHDLRAPLRTIDGFSQAIVDDYSERLDAQGQRYLQRVREASQQMAQLIDDMLTLSRLTRDEVKKEKVNLSALVRDTANDLQTCQPGRQVDFVIQDDVVVEADKRLIQAVMQNLIGNAWKFTSHHPKALIEFGIDGQRDGRPVYFVKDDGAGFDMAYADKLFGAFQRLHDPQDFAGSGIGLATVQRVIHRHGGDIWAEGAVEQGACFYFTL